MIGSLSTLKSKLSEGNIHEFKSLKEVMNFQSSYSTIRQQLVFRHENIIEDERKTLIEDLEQIKASIEREKQQAEKRLTTEIENLQQQINVSKNDLPKNVILKLKNYITTWNNKRKLQNKEHDFDTEVAQSVGVLMGIQEVKKKRFDFIDSEFDKAVAESAQPELSEIDRKKLIIDESSNHIYGALGEQKVVKTLESLSDDYHLINDFGISFTSAIYHRRDNDYIKSIQIDHLLVAPSGIFLVETKNWSEKSLQSLSLRSPVAQIRRTSFVLFKLLNNEMSNYNLSLDNHHWGDKKISIKNLIVLTNIRPKEEFQYVKVLALNELLSYINYFKPIFSISETQRIAEFLIELNNKRTILTN